MPVDTIKWIGGTDGCARIIDQTLLPNEYKLIDLCDIKTMWQAIKVLQIRGAPVLAIAAAYGVVLGLREVKDSDSAEALKKQVNKSCEYIAGSRPTAVNLFWGLDRMKKAAEACTAKTAGQMKEHLLTEAHAIRDEDARTSRAIGDNGAPLIKDGFSIITHCNAGGLVTADYGTALAVMFTAHQQGRRFQVYADETRPLWQGARLTAWELVQAGIDVTVICDNMAGSLMNQGKIDLVITGADRIARNGDTANKIGTYSLAVLAHVHNVPFYIAAPISTFDPKLADGSGIPIEQRDRAEVSDPFGHRIAPVQAKVYNPAFDVTLYRYIAGFITECGIIRPPYKETISRLLASVG